MARKEEGERMAELLGNFALGGAVFVATVLVGLFVLRALGRFPPS